MMTGAELERVLRKEGYLAQASRLDIATDKMELAIWSIEKDGGPRPPGKERWLRVDYNSTPEIISMKLKFL